MTHQLDEATGTPHYLPSDLKAAFVKNEKREQFKRRVMLYIGLAFMILTLGAWALHAYMSAVMHNGF